MYLKRLEIQGFKSFAEKTVLEFNNGITSVVGPNGSGKSNISDSIRWVLGEQSAKHLRGSKMEDCIFAGTEHRKPLGFAEVTLTLDNNDNYLPFDFSEVTITRRVFRSGESEYFINKTSCRLKDIIELFFDTGVGKDGYSIIGQGRIDEILSSKSEERRHIFEEASGIMKYKVRKMEAERKIELARQNLLRINDIINELESQLEPLRQQSETARKFLNLREQLKEIEISVFADNISKYKEKLKEFVGQFEDVERNITDEKSKLEQYNFDAENKAVRHKEMDALLDITREECFSIDTSIEKCDSGIKVLLEKIDNLKVNNMRIDSEIAELEQKISGYDIESSKRAEKIAYLNKKLEEFTARLSESEKQLEQLNSLLDEGERYIEELKSKVMDKLDLLSDKRTHANSVKNVIENIKKKKSSLENEKRHHVVEKDRHFINREELREKLSGVIHSFNKIKDIYEKALIKKNGDEAKIVVVTKKINSVNSESQFKKSRFMLLSDLEKSLEGYNKSVKSILAACRQTPELGDGIHGALAQLVFVEQKYETAIEMALGGNLQNIVTSTEEDAQKAIGFLKQNKLGRATFLPITSIKGKRMEENLGEIKKMPGFIGAASDLVRYEDVYKGVIMNLLGRVVIVDNLDSGIGMARRFNYGFRVVTLEGDILSTSGSLSGGSSESKGPGILSRNREIGELKTTLDELNKTLAILQEEEKALKSSLNNIVLEVNKKADELKELEMEKFRLESSIMQEDAFLSAVSGKVDLQEIELSQLNEQQSQLEHELNGEQRNIFTIGTEIEETKRIISENQEKYKADQGNRDSLHRDITDLKISVNSIVESLNSVNENIERIAAEKQASLNGIEKRKHEKSRNLKDIDFSGNSINKTKYDIEGLQNEKAAKQALTDKLAAEKAGVEEEIKRINESIKDINKNFTLLQEDLGRIEVKKARLELEIEAMQNRMWDEYEVTFTAALEMKKDYGSLTQAQRQINDLKNQMKDLGIVNVAAIEEYQKTRERYEFMTVQKNDLEQTEEKLKRVIYEMTSIMKRQFSEQFRLINENFNIVFRELFGGGRAELKLEDENNILESGIEIEAQPPGKKLQNMMLLSGGERAFTAIALLFGILRLKPSPFCILDEIEAALDDANVVRFALYLKMLSTDTQFIMITHRKGTMEAADVLYGVTMQEHGVSRLVSLKLGEQAS